MGAVFDWTLNHPLHALGLLAFGLSYCGLFGKAVELLEEKNQLKNKVTQLKAEVTELKAKIEAVSDPNAQPEPQEK